MSDCRPRIAVVGAGLVGERHARLVAASANCELTAIIDPRPEIGSVAEALSCRHVPEIDALADLDVDAAIIATPNHSHFAIGIMCLERGLPCLVEKPITDSLEDASHLVGAFEEANLPLLVGHHRRYHPFVAEVRRLLISGELGAPVCASTMWAVKKPHSYYEAGAWRLGTDGGPIMINFIHEVDMMRCLFGEVLEVSAISSNHQRGTNVEDTAAMAMRFEGGFVVTAILSDAALTPWSFEGASGENPNIATTNAASWRVGCSRGAFEFPAIRVWRHEAGEGDWSKPLQAGSIDVEKVVPLERQLDHFLDLVTGVETQPMVSGRDGLESLRAARAVLHSAQTKQMVSLSGFPSDQMQETPKNEQRDQVA